MCNEVKSVGEIDDKSWIGESVDVVRDGGVWMGCSVG